MRAFRLAEQGGALQGDAYPRWTWSDALAAFARSHDEAMALAMEGHRLAPAHAPPSDAVLRLQFTTRALSPGACDAPAAEVVAATRDHGSLARAALVASPRWGGGGAVEVDRLCDAYASLVERVKGYDHAACFAEALFRNPFPKDVKRTAAGTVLESSLAILGPLSGRGHASRAPRGTRRPA